MSAHLDCPDSASAAPAATTATAAATTTTTNGCEHALDYRRANRDSHAKWHHKSRNTQRSQDVTVKMYACMPPKKEARAHTDARFTHAPGFEYSQLQSSRQRTITHAHDKRTSARHSNGDNSWRTKATRDVRARSIAPGGAGARARAGATEAACASACAMSHNNISDCTPTAMQQQNSNKCRYKPRRKYTLRHRNTHMHAHTYKRAHARAHTHTH